MFEPTWIQTTVSQLAGVRGCRRKIYMYNDVAKTSTSSFRRVGTSFSGKLNSHKLGPFCSSAATLARLFHVEIFWLVDESNTKFALRNKKHLKRNVGLGLVGGEEGNTTP